MLFNVKAWAKFLIMEQSSSSTGFEFIKVGFFIPKEYAYTTLLYFEDRSKFAV